MSGLHTLQYTIALLSALILLIYVYIKWSFKHWERRKIFQVKPSIPLGNFDLKSKKPFTMVLADIYKEIKRKKHDFGGFYVLSMPFFMPTSPELVKDILVKNFSKFSTRGFYCNEEGNPLSAHMFAAPYNKWKPLRSKFNAVFSSAKLKGMVNAITECSKPLIELVQQKAINKELFDAQDYFQRYTIDVIGCTVFGINASSFADDENAFKKFTGLLMRPTGYNACKVNFCFILPNLAKILGLNLIHNDLSEFILKIITENMEYREKNNIVRNDLFDILIALGKQENGLTSNQMGAQAMLFLIAGFDTSASAMTFLAYELACHQEYQDRAREEIRTVLKKYNGEITYEALQEMTYLQQVIEETYRKYPPLGHLNRECTEEYTIPNTDIVIEKGTSVIISHYGLQHDPEYFPDPEKFDPERFSPENIKNINQFAYLPFGEGPRFCIGMRFGGLISKIGLVGVLKNHKFNLGPKTKINYDRKCIVLVNDSNVDLIVTRV